MRTPPSPFCHDAIETTTNILPPSSSTTYCSIGNSPDSVSSSSSSSTLSFECGTFKPSSSRSLDILGIDTSRTSSPIAIPTQELSTQTFPSSSLGGLSSMFDARMNMGTSSPEPLLSSSLPPAASHLPLNIQKQLCQNLFDSKTMEEDNAKWMPMQRDVQHFLATGQNPTNLAPGWNEFAHRGSI